MPAKRISCPECGSPLKTGAVNPGTKIRCPGCQHVFKVEEPEDDLPVAKPLGSSKVQAQKPTRRSSADDFAVPAAKSSPRKADRDEPRPSRKSSRPRDDDDDDDDDRPVRRGKGRSEGGGNGLLVLGVLGGLLVLGGGAAAIFFATRGEKDTDTPQIADGGGLPPAPPGGGGGGIVPPAGGGGGGGGAMSAEVLDRVKKATVYIRVTGHDGKRSTGSGFFAFNQNLILTNAHVIHMLERGSPRPQRVEVIIDSGEKTERGFLADIGPVDQSSDLAVLWPRATTGVVWPPPLKVLPATGLRETQQLFVVGYPLGESLGKNVTVSSTSVSSLRKDEQGILEQIQVNGGMHPGNSGGPVVDPQGNVVGVAVAGIKGTTLNFAIPGEKVRAILKGRISEASLGEVYPRTDRQLAVKLTLSTLDPLESIKSMSVDWWVGDPGDPRPPSDALPTLNANDGPRTTTPVDYKADLAVGIAELVVGKLPPPGKTLWCQPSVIDGEGQKRWLAALPHRLLPPIEDKPITLSQQLAPGRFPIELRNAARYRFRTSDGTDHSFDRNIKARFSEDVRQVEKDGSALVYLGVDGRFEVGYSVDGKAPEVPPRLGQILQSVGNLGMILVLDSEGSPNRRGTDLRRIPAQARPLLNTYADQLHDAFDAVNVPLPAGEITPGKRWTAQKTYPIPSFDDEPIGGLFTMTYTYRGVRDFGDAKFAILDISGTLYGFKGAITRLSGSASGEVAYDLATRRVSQVNMKLSVTLSLRYLGEEVTSDGKMEVEFRRGASKPLPASLPTLGDREAVAGLDEVRRLESGGATPAVIAFSPDGKYVATAGPGCRSILIFDVAQGKAVMRGDSLGWPVHSLSFSKNGKYLVAGGTDVRGVTISMWESDGGEFISRCQGHTGAVRSVWLTDNNNLLVSGSHDGTIRLWDAQSGRMTRGFDPKIGPINTMAISPRNSLTLVPRGNEVAVIDLHRGQVVRTLKNHPAVKVLALPSGFAVSGCSDGSLRLWDPRTATESKVWKDHKGRIDHLSATADGKKLLTGSADGTMRLYDLETHKLLHTFQSVEGFGVTAISPDGKYIATAAWPSGDVRLFEISKATAGPTPPPKPGGT